MAEKRLSQIVDICEGLFCARCCKAASKVALSLPYKAKMQFIITSIYKISFFLAI